MKYPAILKNTIGGQTVLAVSGKLFIHMSGEFEVEDSESYSFDSRYKNITAEYLANTYGEVKSKEHAEFIVKLAEANDIKANNQYRNGCYFCFHRADNNDLYIGFYERGTACNKNEKQITIPLPPECESVDEWPKVGDEVMFTDLLQHYDAYRDNYCLKTSKVIARFNTEQGEFITVHREYCAVMTVRVDMVLKDGALVKPKTPEQELRDDIEYAIHHFEGDKVAGGKWLMSKYSITKKPQ